MAEKHLVGDLVQIGVQLLLLRRLHDMVRHLILMTLV